MADAPAPTFGNRPKPKNRALLIGGLAVGGVAGFVWYERKKSAPATSTGQNAYDPNAIDPATGVPYGSETSYMGGVGTTPGQLGTYNPLTGQYLPGLGSTIPTATVPASNAQWASAAEATLLGDNFDPNSTAIALGLYLAGQPLTQDQYNIVQAAIGFAGNPPVSVPSPILIGGGGQGNSGNGSTGQGNTHPAPQPMPVQRLPLPNISGVEIWSAIGDIVRAGYELGTVSYNYQNIDYNNYLGHTVASYGVVPGTNRVNIGLN